MTTSTPWSEVYLAHYQRYFGKPFDVQTFSADDGTAIRIATYDQPFQGFRIYASAGLSDQARRLAGLGEIIMFDDEKGRDVQKIFANYPLFILQHNIPMTGPFTIGGLDNLNAAFADYYDRVAAYFMRPQVLGPDFAEVERAEETGTIFLGVFISGAEQDYLKRQGSPAFEQKFWSQLFALDRRACV